MLALAGASLALSGKPFLGVPISCRRAQKPTQTPGAAVAASASAAAAGAAVVRAVRRSSGRSAAPGAAAAPSGAATPLALVGEEALGATVADYSVEQPPSSSSSSSSSSGEVAGGEQQPAAGAGLPGPQDSTHDEQAAMPELASKPPRPVDSQGDMGSSHLNTTDSAAGSGMAGISQHSGGGGGGGSSSSSSTADRRRRRQQRRRRRGRQQQQPQQQAEAEEEGEVVLAGRRYDSLLDVRYQMRVLQRELLGDAEEVAVPRGSPHFETIEAVFALHPQRCQKANDPIRCFFVVRNPHVAGGKGCEFQFEDAHGLRDDFSLLKCTRSPPLYSKRAQLLEACAHAVAGQLAEAGKAAAADPALRGPSGALLCSRCGLGFKVEIAYQGWPLSKLVHTYRETAAPGRPPSRFGRDPKTQQATLRQQPEPEAAWARGWVDFHRRHAQLAPLCKCCQGAAADARRAQRLAAEGLPHPV